MEPVSLAIIGGMGWLGILAKNYSTEMIKIAVERQRREFENTQKELERKQQQFDIIFQNLLTRVNEERESIQSLLSELRIAIERSAEVDRLVMSELIEVKKMLSCPIDWSGEERRSNDRRNNQVKEEVR